MKSSMVVLVSFVVLITSSAIFASSTITVGQLVAELKSLVADSRASSSGKAEIDGIVDQCATQTTTQAVCACLNVKLPSRAQKLVTRCNSLSSN